MLLLTHPVQIQNNFEEDFVLEPALKSRVQLFLTAEASADGFLGKTARNLLEQLQRKDARVDPVAPTTPPVVPLACRRSPPQQLGDIPPSELGRQLTLLELPLFRSIRAQELMHTAWMKPDKETRAPHVLADIRWFNRVSYWAITEVLKQRTLRERASAIRKLVRVAAHLRDMLSFSMMQAIVAALLSLPVSRLRQTWDELARNHRKSAARFEELKTLCSPQEAYKRLRQAIRVCIRTTTQHSLRVLFVPNCPTCIAKERIFSVHIHTTAPCFCGFPVSGARVCIYDYSYRRSFWPLAPFES